LAARYFDASEDGRMALFYYQNFLNRADQDAAKEAIQFTKERIEILKSNK